MSLPVNKKVLHYLQPKNFILWFYKLKEVNMVSSYVDFIKKIHLNVKSGLYICISTKRKNKWRDHFFKTPLDKETLEDFFNNFDTNRYDLYFCPHPFKEPKRLKENAIATPYLWSDLDNANPLNVNPKPNIAWESSPNRYACLWILQETPSLKETEELNKKLAYANGADVSGWDLTQVLRIPGTRNHKYTDSPHGKLLWDRGVKPYKEIVMMDGYSNSATEILKKYNISPFTIKKLYSEAKPGVRSEVLWKLENILVEKGLSKEEILIVIQDSPWNKFVKRESQLKREIDKAIESHPQVDKLEKKRKEKKEFITIVPLEDIQPEVVEWLWYPYIPKGKLTIIEGDPGLGKSWLTMALANYISEGKKLPYNEDKHKGPVLILSAEDGIADTIKPRIISLGGTGKDIYAIPEAFNFSIAGIEALDQAISKINPLLIIIDPLVAYFGGKVDLHKANETREIMSKLSILAEKHKTSILCVRHLAKGQKDKAIYRGIGSIDLTAAARSCLAIGRNPENPNEGRVICHIKCNLAPLGKPLSYYLHPNNKKSPFEFGEHISVDVNAVLNQEPTDVKGILEEASDWLEAYLQTNGPTKVVDIKRESEGRGILWENLRKVKKSLKIEAKTVEEEILWSLPKI